MPPGHCQNSGTMSQQLVEPNCWFGTKKGLQLNRSQKEAARDSPAKTTVILG